jgi:SUMO ligase MMS21 Smc5/6 complex component
MLMVDLDELSCPISFQLMTDPVVATDGHTYQRDAIEAWIKKCTTGKEPAQK